MSVRWTVGNRAGVASNAPDIVGICRGGCTVEQADAISVNADIAINRALNDFLAFMVDFPDIGLAGLFGGLVPLVGCVDLTLQLLANFAGLCIGTGLSCLFLGDAYADSMDVTGDSGKAGE